MARGPLLNRLDELEEKCKHKDPSLQDIVNVFASDGHFVLILFLIIPFLQPIPLFGLSTPFGMLIALIASFAYYKKSVWIPKIWAVKKLPSKSVSMVAEASERMFEKLTFLFKPRWRMFLRGPFRSLNTLVIILAAFLLALPLPIPLSNALPAWAILLQTLAHLEDDGALILLSYLQTIATLIFFFLISEGVKRLISASRTLSTEITKALSL